MSHYWASGVYQARWLAKNGRDVSIAFSSQAEAEVLTQQFRDQTSFAEVRDHGRIKQFEEGLFQAYIISQFLASRQAYACSPQGSVLKVSSVIHHHRDWLIDCHWEWPARENAAFYSYFKFFDEGKFSADDVFDRFCCFDASTGLIKEKNITLKGLEDAAGYPDYERAAQNLLSVLIRPLTGWALCWKEDTLPETLEECLDELGLVEDDWRMALHGEKVQSQGTGLAATLASVLEAYPNGKGTDTWPQVESRVGYSRRNIVRALNTSVEHRGWATRGQ